MLPNRSHATDGLPKQMHIRCKILKRCFSSCAFSHLRVNERTSDPELKRYAGSIGNKAKGIVSALWCYKSAV